MRPFLLFVFPLLCLHLFAQPDMRPHYSPLDTLAASTERVASRTYYTTCTGNNCQRRDSIIEKYDRAGNMIELDEFTFADYYKGGSFSSRHYFVYDSRNRIIYDSCYYPTRSSDDGDNRWVIHYTYDTVKNLIVEQGDMLGQQYRQYIWYNDKNKITAQLRKDKSGDTLSYIVYIGDTERYIYSTKSIDEDYTWWDTSISVTTTTSQINYDHDYFSGHYYDRSGKLLYEVSYNEGRLHDSTQYTYNSKGQLTRKTSVTIGLLDDDPDYITSFTEYKYDAKGRLTEEKYWEQHTPKRVSITRYTYNDQGLLAEKRTTVQFDGKDEFGVGREVWGYGYY